MAIIDTSDYSRTAMALLCKGKTDSQLLYALVAALTEHNQEQIRMLLAHTSSEWTTGNIQIAAAICAEVNGRGQKKDGK